MKSRMIARLAAVTVTALVFGTSHLAAQRGAGLNSRPGQYDLSAEKTFSGTVEDVRRVGGPGPAPGTHVVLKTDSTTIELALGPSWYMTEKNFSLVKGDQIEVIGVMSRVEGGDVVLVREIKKGSETMAFRNASGWPLWSHGAPGAARNLQPGQYDLTAERTISGIVEEVRRVGGSGPTPGTHVTLSTATGTIDLALGPTWYMTEKNFTLAKGDQIEVIGVMSSVEGSDVVLVREIKKGSETMAFRNADGWPLWSQRAVR